jgi:hypothetical protein
MTDSPTSPPAAPQVRWVTFACHDCGAAVEILTSVDRNWANNKCLPCWAKSLA